MDQITLLTNAAAGSNDESSVEEAASILRTKTQVNVVATESDDDLREVVQSAQGVIVVAGGDGSLHAAIAALDDVARLGEVAIGLVPLGTGNDFARTMGVPLDDPAAAARAVLNGSRHELDVMRDDTGGLVVNAVHAGVGADAAKRAQPFKGPLGKVGYSVGALVAGLTTRGHALRVEVDGRTLADGSRKVFQVAVGNGRYVGGGTPLVPDADPADGALDVVVSFSVGPLRRLGYALRLSRGRHTRESDVATGRGRSVTVSGDDFWLNADGELVGPTGERSWTVEPGAFTFVVPG